MLFVVVIVIVLIIMGVLLSAKSGDGPYEPHDEDDGSLPSQEELEEELFDDLEDR